MAPTPRSQPKWFHLKSPSYKLAEPTPPSNSENATKNNTNTKSPTSKPVPGSSTPTTPPLLRDLYTSLETSYNPLLTIICNHAFIKEARYPVRQSARIRFVRDVNYEGGLLGYSDEAVKRVLVDVKRFFLERVGRVDVFDEEGCGFGEEVDDLAGYHVVVGDGVDDGFEDGEDVVEGVFGAENGVQSGNEGGWETESESKVSGVNDAVDEFERAVGSVKSASQMLRDIAAALAGSPSHQSSESPSVKAQRQAKPTKSEKKRKRKHKQSLGDGIVEAVEAALAEINRPLDNHEEMLAEPIQSEAKPAKHDNRKRKDSHGEESVEAVPYESDKPPEELEEEPVDPVESQVKSVKLSKSQKNRKRKRSRDEQSVELSREIDEPLGGDEEASINPVKSQIKPVQHENKRKPIDKESVKRAVETDLPLDDPKAKPTDPVETNTAMRRLLIDDKSHASIRRVRKHKKNRKDRMKADKYSSKDASTKLNTSKQNRDNTSVLDF